MTEPCEYLAVHNQPCGEPATHSYVTAAKKRFCVCADHASKVYRDTRKKVNPEPLVKTVLAANPDAFPLHSRAASGVYAPSLPPVKPGKSLSQLFREQQESVSEGSDQP
jgi:hypothetical protein